MAFPTSSLAGVRCGLYLALLVWSFLTFILAAVMVGTTEKDFGGYNGASIELLVAALLPLGALIPLYVERRWTSNQPGCRLTLCQQPHRVPPHPPSALPLIHHRRAGSHRNALVSSSLPSHPPFRSPLTCTLRRLLFLGGAAAFSNDFMGLSCFRSSLCTRARALEAFSWLAWITLSILLGLLVFVAVRNKSWRESFGDEGVGHTSKAQAEGAQTSTAPVTA